MSGWDEGAVEIARARLAVVLQEARDLATEITGDSEHAHGLLVAELEELQEATP